MFVNYNLEDIKSEKVNLNKDQKKDVRLILQSFKHECIDISSWRLVEIARTNIDKVYAFENTNNAVYMKITSNGVVLPCYFKNHDLDGYSEFVANSINEAIKLHEKSYNPKLCTSNV